eukprot:s3116_g11.t2
MQLPVLISGQLRNHRYDRPAQDPGKKANFTALQFFLLRSRPDGRRYTGAWMNEALRSTWGSSGNPR